MRCSEGAWRIDGVAPIPSPRTRRSFWCKSGAERPVRQAAVAGIKPPAPPNFKNPFRPAHSAASPPHRPHPPRCCKLRIIRDSIARTLIICLRSVPRGRIRSPALPHAARRHPIDTPSASWYRTRCPIPLEVDSCPSGHDRRLGFIHSALGLIGLKISCHRYGPPSPPKPRAQAKTVLANAIRPSPTGSASRRVCT
ncbi:hypothetical protein PMIN01_01041 [Paraphaeosphaeria minitans]|uniref:Uncharacterized protein n=1 Tax=Paraphaeosphaeria minitans TaxID=565426 RepID=A0A9P6KWI3_9PLEO|nr:hypothetical protein PMIN01_01041 [Paraphaeosphaeria minitans]